MRGLALLLLLAVLPACGGGDGGEEARGPLPRAEYTRLANAICAETERKLDALGGFESFDELSKEMLVGEKALRQSADALRALEPPAQLKARHGELADLQDETADIAQSISIAAADDDQLEMQKQAERADKVTESSNEVARALGLEECVAG